MGITRERARAQAAAITDDLGQERNTLRPVETITELMLIAGHMVESMQEGLEGSISSGQLSKSVEADEPTVNGNTVEVDITMNFYGKFVNSGVKGTKGGSSKAGYHFRGDYPPEKFVQSIRKWLKKAKKSTRSKDVQKYGAYGKNEKKQKSLADIELSASFAIARSIMQKGIKGTGFIDRAAATAEKKIADRLGQAFAFDIVNSIP